MNSGRTVFAQLIEHLPHKEFQKCVARYRGDRYAKNFSCWDQYLAMAFAQFTYRESLRDIETCLSAVGGKLYHMGFRTSVARSTLADANESRDWRIYADFAQTLIATARNLYARDPLAVKWIKQHLRIKAFYGTTENAVKTQIWIAISVYVLVAIVKKRLKLEQSLYSLLQILSVTLFEKTPILCVLQAIDEGANFIENVNQLILFDF